MANRTKFTPEKRQQFLAALSEFPNVSAAAESVSLSRVILYTHRSNDTEFAAEWDAAIDEGIEKVEATALKRGLATSDTLLIFMLKAYRPEKYRENVRHELTGANGGAIQVDINDLRNMSDDDLQSIVTG
jgi:hypothetical protein